MAGPARTGRVGHRRRTRPLLRTKIGEVLRQVRRQQGRTLADVARAARVSMPYLSEVERGRKEASSEILAAICEALRIDLADLLAGVAGELAAGARQPGAASLDAARIRRAQPEAGGRAGRPQPEASGPAGAACLLAA